MNTTAPIDCPAWKKLQLHAEDWHGERMGAHLTELLAGDSARAHRFIAEAPGVRLDYTRQRINGLTMSLLAQLAAERGFDEWRAALFAGRRINTTEERAAWHTALRAGEAAPQEVRDSLARLYVLVSKLRSQRKIRRIVNLGIGGSSLGPRLLCDAFGDASPFETRFVSNIDPLELDRALAGAEPASTLVVVVSKSFDTQETLSNATKAKKWLAGQPNLYAVTAKTDAARAYGCNEVLPMWDWVGGRFSVWSSASFAAACAIGIEAFGEFIAGGRETDVHFLETPVQDNVPALLALLGVWNVNFLGANAHAVLPYAHRLRFFPDWLQQLEMESNGKRVDHEGRRLGYATCPVIFGAEGTPAQHSFTQLLHQGTTPVPVDFIVAGIDAVLDANAEAQAQALAFGTGDTALPPHRQYPGNRPSSTIRLRGLKPRDLGRLIALYEHKVFTQGVLWNINSFDQWGVELGKTLAGRIVVEGKKGES